MSNDDSFDPKSWVPGGSARPSLPEAWRDVSLGRDESDYSSREEADKGSGKPPRRLALTILGLLSTAPVAGLGYWLVWPDSEASSERGSMGLPGAAADLIAGTDIPQAVVTSRRLVVASPADLFAALRNVGLSAAESTRISKTAMSAIGKAQGEVHVAMTLVRDRGATRLDRLEASLADGSGLIVSLDAEQKTYQVSRVAAELSRQIKVIRGELDTNSFYSSAVAAGVIDTLIPEFVNAFSFDFDLQQEVAPGDRFEVAYEQTVDATGRQMGQPRLLFAALATEARSRALYRFKASYQDAGWFDGNGASSVRSLMRTPVDGARISSKFGYRRHPILHYMKLHRGTDFAAPSGTPIYASGDAVVEFAAFKGANGNLTVLRHDNGWRTLYLHQSRFMDGIAAGARVRQGQQIGEVGTTGRSTGPHLHYEVHIDNEPVDPQSIKTESGRKALDGSAKTAFLQQRNRVDIARARQTE